VLFEMLTGKRLFHGETTSDTLAAVLKTDPDWSLLPAETPPRIRELLRRCLTRDPHERLRDMGEARIEIERAGGEPTAEASGTPRPPLRRQWLTAAVGAVVGGLVVAAAMRTATRPSKTSGSEPARFSISLPEGFSVNTGTLAPNSSVAVSPSGRLVAYLGSRGPTFQLFLRSVDQFEGNPIAGTEGGTSPFFSPDGSWLGFVANGKMMKVQLPGGTPQIVFEVFGVSGLNIFGGADWAQAGILLSANSARSAISRVTATGGALQPVTVLDQGRNEIGHSCPQLLPGGNALLFTAASEDTPTMDDARIEVQRLDSGERKTLVVGGNCGRYVPTGHLVYARAGALLAVPFDLARLEVKGAPVSVVEGVTTDPQAGGMHFAISESGTLAYVPGSNWTNDRRLARVTRSGVLHPLLEHRSFADVAIAPDGRRLVLHLANEAVNHLWLSDIERGSLTRLTLEGGAMPVWAPNGERVAYWNDHGETGIYWRKTDGADPELLLKSTYVAFPESFSPDGSALVYTDDDPQTRGDIWLLPLQGERAPRALVKTRFHEWGARVSPDGRWLAYTSDESGRREVYVQTFPEPGSRRQVSTDGGSAPGWARSGRELFFRSDSRLMVVGVNPVTGATEKPRLLFDVPGFTDQMDFTARYDVAPDDQSFIVITDTPRPPLTKINVVLNWFEELKQRVPSGAR
jgi:serine/threonine-protein kinase